MLNRFLRLGKVLLSLDIFTMLQLSFSNISKGRVFFYRKSVLTFSKSSKIIAKKGFYFNNSWTTRDPFPSLLHLEENASLTVNGKFVIYSGSRVYINNGASLILGSGFSNNNFNLSCFERIEIGENVVISENVTIRDSDNHTIVGNESKITQPINIGNNVWIGLNVTILKGVTIGNGCIVAAGSLVNKDIPEGCLCAGVPAKVIKQNVEWIR